MKKLGLLIVGAFLLAACDATPGGNKSILPVVHDGNMEQVEAAEAAPVEEEEVIEEEVLVEAEAAPVEATEETPAEEAAE